MQRVIDAFGMDQCLIFCRTNFDCDNLEKFLNQLGGPVNFDSLICVHLHSKYVPQVARVCVCSPGPPLPSSHLGWLRFTSSYLISPPLGLPCVQAAAAGAASAASGSPARRTPTPAPCWEVSGSGWVLGLRVAVREVVHLHQWLIFINSRHH